MFFSSSLWPGRIDDDELAVRRLEPHAGRIQRDRLVALGLKAVEHKRPFERNAAPGRHRRELLGLAGGQQIELVQQPAQQRRLAVIDMAGKDEHQRSRALHHM